MGVVVVIPTNDVSQKCDGCKGRSSRTVFFDPRGSNRKGPNQPTNPPTNPFGALYHLIKTILDDDQLIKMYVYH
jgi:hypothetical protein